MEEKKTKFNYLKVWGCLVFYRVLDLKMIKLRPKALKENYVGHIENSKSYRIFDSSSNIIVKSRDVEFIENKF